ncbi:MAG: hypothetical protein Q8L60_09230 [Gammaproteobacteria bacterium]|nr:hypothetical protein [Gammaproteobacteria bacterium]MDP2140569.1 hypothetical protein [Gammaproteobacteria bacterium]MDP2347338.1 hypothetical protein [Gammaproteobacteria bacterium]
MSNRQVPQQMGAAEVSRLIFLLHELSQPLTAIQNYAHAGCAMLASDNADHTVLLSLFEKISEQSLRGNRTSNELSALVRSSGVTAEDDQVRTP